MKPEEIFLVMVYLVGAVVDAVVSVPMFSAAFSVRFDSKISYFIACGAVLMVSWTVLLLWAALKPVERRPILWITLIPILGIFISRHIVSFHTGVPADLFRLVGAILLAALCTFAYIFTKPGGSGLVKD